MKQYIPATGQIITLGRSGPQPPPDPNISFGLYNVFINGQFSIWSCPFDGRVQIRNRVSNAVITQVPAGFPYGVQMTHDKTKIIVADYGTGITVWSGSNFQNGLTLNTGAHVGFVGLVLAETHGFVYASDYDNGQILLIDYTTGSFSVVVSGLNGPEGIDLDIDGEDGDRLIVADVRNERLISVNPDSGHFTTIARNLPIGGLPAPLILPPPNIMTGVAVDSNHNIYFTSDIQNALYFVECSS